MGGPAWLADVFAGVMITVAAYCTSRLVVARWSRRPTDVDSDGVQMVMGVAMAGMLVTGLRFLSAGIWEAVFAAAAAWFAWRFIRMRGGAPPSLWRSPQPGPYLVECGAMLYMYLALPAVAVAAKGAAGGISATGTRFSFLALVLALFILGYVAWVGDRFPAPAVAPAVAPAGAAPATGLPEESGARMSATVPESAGAASHGGGAGAGRGSSYLAPRCAAMCKIAMGITMGYILILML